MRPTSTQLLVWAPRLLGLALCLFLGLFALDAFDERQNLARSLADFAIHLLPALILVPIVLLSWRRPWIGGIVFIAVAVLYATALARGRLDWIAVIAGPLFVVGLLFLWSWRQTADVSTR
jgi:O-antigen ligase